MNTVLLEWLGREGWIVLNWWLLVTLAGAAALPLCLRLLGGLPDRGYTLARPAGLLLVGFAFWLLASLGLLPNTAGSIVLAWALVLAGCLLVYRRGPNLNLRDWWRENRRLILVTELLFALLLLSWALIRAHQHGIVGTEKPMELAFMSAIQRSSAFPPNDPWMSGYAISYYYFGYVLSAMLSMLSGIPATTGFNMTVALLVALTGTAVFGVVYNLVQSRPRRTDDEKPRPAAGRSILFGMLGLVLVVGISNFQPLLVEFPYQARIVPESYLRFWDAKNRDAYTEGTIPVNLLDAQQSRAAGWWWFNAARTLTERDLAGNRVNEVIDEFPAFSFLLADVHPHVLALPFAVLALGLALNVLLLGRPPSRPEVLFYALCLGGLVFLNAWDGPVYLVLLLGAEALRRQMARGRLALDDWAYLLGLGLALGALMLLFYLPFFIGFRSQLGGVLPNLLHPTRFQQYFLMFGPLLLLLVPFLLLEARRAGRSFNIRLGLAVPGILLAALAGALLLFTVIGFASPVLQAGVLGWIEQNGGMEAVLPALIGRRLDPLNLLTTVFLLALITLVVGRLFATRPQSAEEEQPSPSPYPAAAGFALLLVGAGVVLTLIPEFVYLRDNFGTRMNTVFKFYYQAWLMFGVAAAYGVYALLAGREPRRPPAPLRLVYSGLLALVLAAGLVYLVLGLWHRMFVETSRTPLNMAFLHIPLEGETDYRLFVTDGQFVRRGQVLAGQVFDENGAAVNPVLARQDGQVLLVDGGLYVLPSLTLDGGRTMVSEDDYNVLMCLAALVPDDRAVVAEAVRDSYNSYYGRVGAITGIPIVLGWENHQSQWRGLTYGEVAGSRRPDMETLFTDLRWDVAYAIIQRYSISHILFGTTERAQYGSAGEQKFMDYLDVVCESGSSRLYYVRQNISPFPDG